jgi:hypothetical protein
LASRSPFSSLVAGIAALVAGCGGTSSILSVDGSTTEDGSVTVDGPATHDARADVTTDRSPVDSPPPLDATRDAASDGADVSTPEEGGVTPIGSCAMSTQCGSPGDTCCSGAKACYCQDYGQPRCLGSPFATTGHAGDACHAGSTCDPGLTCVQFGPGTICLHCGD